MTCFLIDDDQIFQFITDSTLKRNNPNISIEKYYDGEQGINSIKERLDTPETLPDIVMLYINMPFMNG